MATRLRGRGIEIVTINVDDEPANATSFLREYRLAGLTVVNDAAKKIVEQFEPPKMPTSFVIDKAGVVRAINAGYEDGDEDKIEQQLRGLAEK